MIWMVGSVLNSVVILMVRVVGLLLLSLESALSLVRSSAEVPICSELMCAC